MTQSIITPTSGEHPFTPENLENILTKEFILIAFDKKYADALETPAQLGQIIFRAPGRISIFTIGYTHHILDYSNGFPLILPPNHCSYYLLALQNVNFPKNQPPVLKTAAQEYDLTRNLAKNPTHTFLLYFKEQPAYKTTEALFCMEKTDS